MSVRNQRALIILAGGPLLLAAVFSMVWSVFPIFGDTLPHLIEQNVGVPFKLSALLVALVTGVLGVVGMIVFSFFPLTFSTERS